MHARILIGDAEIMASDVPPDRFEPMRSVYLSLNADSSEEAERLHGLLSQGGQIFMPMQENFIAYRFSMLRSTLLGSRRRRTSGGIPVAANLWMQTPCAALAGQPF